MANAEDEHILDLLTHFDDEDFQSYKVRCTKFDQLKAVLDKKTGNLNVDLLEKILSVCASGLEPDYKYTTCALGVLGAALSKVEAPTDSLSKSATTVLNILVLTTKLEELVAIQALCVKTLLLYPEATLNAIITVSNAASLFDVLNMVNCNQKQEIVPNIHILLKKFFKSADNSNLTLLSSAALNWLPNLLNYPCLGKVCFIHTLEDLVEHLVKMDYENHPQWIVVLEQICNQEKYPHTMKKLLVAQNQCWYRLWIILIKLLKTQVTKVNNGSGPSPINSMLPVVEMAFKMDTKSRCQAFACWNALIDNFSLELNESYIVKRLKLLVIPLRSSNAKVPETAIAKFKTWWYLIVKFKEKIENYLELVVIPFLYFCFGKASFNSNVLVPGQLSDAVKELCFEGLVDMMGLCYCNCKKAENGCKLINTKALVCYWGDWIYSLKLATKTAAVLVAQDHPCVKKHVIHLWKSFALTIAELPDNNVRKDIFEQLFSTVKDLSQLCKDVPKLDAVLCTVLIWSLLPDDTRIQELYSKSEKLRVDAISVVLELNSKANTGNTIDIKYNDLVNLKHLLCSKYPEVLDKVIDWLMHNETANDASLFLWLKLSASCKWSDTIWKNMITWPLINMNKISNVRNHYFEVLSSWRTVYAMNAKSAEYNQELINILKSRDGEENSDLSVNLTVGVILTLLRVKVLDEAKELEIEMDMLHSSLKKVASHENLKAAFPLLIDVMVLIIEKVVKGIFVDPETLVKILKIVLKWMASVNPKDTVILVKLISSLGSLFTMKTYTNLLGEIIDELIECSCSMKMLTVVPILKKFLVLISEDGPHYFKIKSAINKLEKKEPIEADTAQNDKKMSTSNTDDATKSKKAPTILKVVEEDGEEFVVVKSNWKFNPRKLTENQKDRLKRKREDIPALYQDLSQSQDEFKLKSWKPDSQDTSSTSTKSTSRTGNDDVSTILKAIPSANVVPKIMENMLSEAVSKPSDGINKPISPAVKDSVVTAKNIKSPRLALKDRVFRNVKSLIEKNTPNAMSISNEPILIPAADLNKSMSNNDLKTPTKPTKVPEVVTNSAPPKISTERPTRTIKKPKKFDDTELIALKRKRSNSNTNTRPSENTEKVKDQIKTDTSDTSVNNNNNHLTENTPKTDESANVPASKSTDVEICSINDSQSVINITDTDATQINKCMDQIEMDSVENNNTNKNAEPEIDETQNSCEVVSPESQSQKQNDDKISVNDIEPSTPKSKQIESNDSKSSVKKKRSRIEKQLLIDMVEGHPLLQAPSVEKRVTRKSQTTPTSSIDIRRKSLSEKLNKLKADLNIPTIGNEKKLKDKNKSASKSSISVSDSQESQLLEDMPMSEDVIESSQDSTITTISVKSSKQGSHKQPIIKLDKMPIAEIPDDVITISDTLDDTKCDIELSKNRTMEQETNLTENMDTEPFDDKNMSGSGDVILINDDEDFQVVINSVEDPEEIEIAEADTQPMGTDTIPGTEESTSAVANSQESPNVDNSKENVEFNTHEDDITKTLPEISLTGTGANACSPLKDETQKKNDFLNDTIEISPIKTLSPIRESKSPPPESSNSYVVIKFTSPVQSNGEPIDKCESPEIFTEEKNSPEKREQSPPRAPVIVNNSSPNKSLSLKKNRPQVRSGRAAQMLGLCAPDKLEAILNAERRAESEIPKTNTTTPARRNLRILYNSATDSNDNEAESDDGENYLKLKRSLPTVDCSPSGPILKRKLAEIADETTVSPASKRKRVSFHDPPVSTTVAVQKYIEPYAIRSPQNSTLKRQERLSRVQMTMKSPKRLDNVFKLDTALTKTVEAFSEEPTLLSMDDIGMSSLDQTPAAEIVKTSELNDVDPICPELLNCNDPIVNIAGKLSSPATQDLFIKEIQGKIQTIGDLAKMTELEVNRLCINAPKVKVAKKALNDYASKKSSEVISAQVVEVDVQPTTQVEIVPEKCCVEIQTNVISSCDVQTETVETDVTFKHTQTEIVNIMTNSTQTDESDRPTEEVITTCLADRPDFVDKLRELLDESAVRCIADKLPYGPCTDVLISKMDSTNSTEIVNRITDNQKFKSPAKQNNKKLDVLQEYLTSRFDSKDLILFCSQLLQKIHNKTTDTAIL